MGRTETDRKITNEPWSSMQKNRNRKRAKEKNSFRRKERSVFKKSLTGPTLLEMYDYRVYQALSFNSSFSHFTVKRKVGSMESKFEDQAPLVIFLTIVFILLTAAVSAHFLSSEKARRSVRQIAL